MSESATLPPPQIIPERLAQLPSVVLAHGGHSRFKQDGVCAMEAVAWLAGEPHSDRPQCVCPVIGALIRRINDRLPSDEERRRLLGPLLPRLIGTRGSPELARRRGYAAADWAVRTILVELCDKRGWAEQAATLRALAEIVDVATAERGRDAARAVRKHAAAAAYAAAAYAAAAADAAAYAYAAAAAAAAAYAAAASLRLVERLLSITE